MARLAAPDYVTGGDQPVGEPGHRRCLQPERPGNLHGPGLPEVGQHREHPELRQGHRAAQDVQAPQRDARQDPGGRLQDVHRLGRQLRHGPLRR